MSRLRHSEVKYVVATYCLVLTAIGLLAGCHHKPRYRVWGASQAEIGQSNWDVYLAMRKNPLYWDCEYQNPPYMPFCKVCIDESKDFLKGEQREVDSSFCKPEKDHQ